MLPAVRANNERAHALGQAHEGIGVLPEQERAVQRWLDVRWNPSATMKLTVGVIPNGEPRENAHESQG